jgi:hypothetical protein
MPVLDIGPIRGTCLTETLLDDAAITKSLFGFNTTNTCVTTCSASLVGRLVGAGVLECEADFSYDFQLKRLLNFLQPQPSVCSTSTQIGFFLSSMVTAKPIGGLHVPSVNQISNPQFVPPGFNGQRFVRGDLISVGFTVQGEKLQGMNAVFTACRRDEPVGSPHDIEKLSPASIRQTAPSVSSLSNRLETVTGNFSILPNETGPLPDGEVEYTYRFGISDGNGAVYTIEVGRFKIYSTC